MKSFPTKTIVLFLISIIALGIGSSFADIINNSLNNTQNSLIDLHAVRDPFASMNNTQKDLPANLFTPINYFPINTLHFVGILKINQQYWAILRLPDGSTRTVTIGNKIGLENGIVVGINTKQIDIKVIVKQNLTSYLVSIYREDG